MPLNFNSYPLLSQKKQQPVEKLVKYMLDIAMGMSHIAGLGLVHRVSECSDNDHNIIIIHSQNVASSVIYYFL